MRILFNLFQKNYLVLGAALFLLVSFNTNNIAQQASNFVSNVSYGTPIEGEPLTLKAVLLQSSNIANITLAFKSFGQSEFIQREMEVSALGATITIPAEEVTVPYLEYYLIIEQREGTLETYPYGIPDEGSPLQISVRALSQKDKEILLLSPARGELVTLADLFISISLIKAPDNVNKEATKIFLDDNDISSLALFAGDLIIFYADNFPEAVSFDTHNLRVEVYDNEGNVYHSISSNFRLVTSEYAEAAGKKFTYRGDIQGESRNETFDEESTWYNNVNANVDASYGNWVFTGNAYITSEEKSYLQPMHRFSISAKSDWLSLRIGDSYPRYPNLIMDGKRIRGFSGNLELGFFNLQTSFGESVRNIDGKLLEIYARTETTNLLNSDVIAIDSVKHGQPYGKVELGTYSRQIFALRPSFGSGEQFQFGLSYLHGKDDMNSSEFAAQPKENAVFGTDFIFRADQQRITISGQAAISLINSDITNGELNDADIDSVFGPGSYYDVDPDQIRTIRDIIGNFITVNQFLGPLNPQEFASFAAEAVFGLNYFNNNFRAKYIYRGNDFYSFGQDYLRTDVKGINLTDRIRLFDNKLFFSFGYESLEDNLQKTKNATTKYNTFNTSISIFPRADFPNITLAYSHYKNENGLSLNSNDSLYVVNDATNRIMAQLSYDIQAGVKHNASLSFVTSTREDDSFWNSDANNTSVSLSVNSYWERNLTSFVSLVYYASDISYNTLDTLTNNYAPVVSEYNYTSLSIGGRYRLLDDKLELTASISPSFGDFERQAFDFVGQYFVMPNLSVILQARFYRIPNQNTNSIIGLTTRLNF